MLIKKLRFVEHINSFNFLELSESADEYIVLMRSKNIDGQFYTIENRITDKENYYITFPKKEKEPNY